MYNVIVRGTKNNKKRKHTLQIRVIALCNANAGCNREQRVFTLAVSVSRQPLCNFLSPSDPSPHRDHYSHIGCLGIKKIDSPPATISLSLLFSRAPLLSSLSLFIYRWLASFNLPPPFFLEMLLVRRCFPESFWNFLNE